MRDLPWRLCHLNSFDNLTDRFIRDDMYLIKRNLFFGVCDRIILTPACSAIETCRKFIVWHAMLINRQKQQIIKTRSRWAYAQSGLRLCCSHTTIKTGFLTQHISYRFYLLSIDTMINYWQLRQCAWRVEAA